MVGTANAMFLSGHDFNVVLLVALVAGAVAMGIGAIVGSAISASSQAIQDEARRFGESGEFTSGVRGPAELQGLSDELARTSRRLQESREREARLEDSRRELVAWVSHDLRTPLAGLRAMTEALEDGIAEDPSRYHRQIRAEVDRMVRMVDDLFELSRIHAGNLRLALEPVALGDLVSEAIASADPVARARGVRLGGGVDAGLEVVADPAELSRVVGNLLMNAIRHTPADGIVEVVGRSGRRRAVGDGRVRGPVRGGHGTRVRRRVAGQRRAHPGRRWRVRQRRRARPRDRQGHRRGAPRHGERRQPRARLSLPGPAPGSGLNSRG
jgi:signal transduction histidine kinase